MRSRNSSGDVNWATPSRCASMPTSKAICRAIVRRSLKLGSSAASESNSTGEFSPQCAPGRHHHPIGDSPRSGGNQTQTNGRKDIDVIAPRYWNLPPRKIDWREWRACGDNRAAVGPPQQIFRHCFGPVRRVRQRKNDRPLNLDCHFSYDGFPKGTAKG